MVRSVKAAEENQREQNSETDMISALPTSPIITALDRDSRLDYVSIVLKVMQKKLVWKRNLENMISSTNIATFFIISTNLNEISLCSSADLCLSCLTRTQLPQDS